MTRFTHGVTKHTGAAEQARLHTARAATPAQWTETSDLWG